MKDVNLTQTKSDYLGILSGLLCTVHCVAAPLITSLGTHFSDGGGIFEHAAIDYTLLSLSWIAVYFSAKHQSSTLIKVILFSGMCMLSVSVVFEDFWVYFHYVNYLSAATIIGAHILSLKYVHKEKHKTK